MTKRTSNTLRLSKELRDRLDNLAQRLDCSRTQVIREAIAAHLTRCARKGV